MKCYIINILIEIWFVNYDSWDLINNNNSEFYEILKHIHMTQKHLKL